jgi:hypothetical protein
MPTFNRKLTQPFGSGGSPVTSVRLAPETKKGLETIKTLFQKRFPQEKFPTLSACLDLALRRYLEEYGNDPVALREELDEFRARYAKEEPR